MGTATDDDDSAVTVGSTAVGDPVGAVADAVVVDAAGTARRVAEARPALSGDRDRGGGLAAGGTRPDLRLLIPALAMWSVVAAGLVVLLVGAIGLRSSRTRS